MNNIFNTTFEIALRVLLELYVTEEAMPLDRIAASDFITIYASDFGISSKNLHGINEFNFSEYSIRRELFQNALKDLLLNEEVRLHTSEDGFTYSITEKGISICEEMTTQYAADYINAAYKTQVFISNKNTLEVLDLINQTALLPKERRH